MSDPYQVLGVSRDASDEEIKKCTEYQSEHTKKRKIFVESSHSQSAQYPV